MKSSPMVQRSNRVSLKDNRGVSLIFAIILVTILLITGSSMSGSFLRASQRNTDLFRSTQAYYAARASMEKAIAAVGVYGVGYEASATEVIGLDTNEDGAADTTGDYDIFARAKPLDWQTESPSACGLGTECYIPLPGTGTAGTDCDFEDETQNWTTDFEDECNWNRIGYGENATIPFFYNDEFGTQNPYDTGLSTFILRVRPPINPDTGSRYTLDDLDDDVILNWQFTGECDEDGDGSYETSCYLVPVVETSGGGFGQPVVEESQIQESDVNMAAGNEYEVLNQGSYGKNQNDYFRLVSPDFLNYEYLNQPYLKLTAVSQLQDLSGNQIPYLEYQIIIDQEISDNKILYSSLGKAEGKLGTYAYPLTASQDIGADPIIHFAVQN